MVPIKVLRPDHLILVDEAAPFRFVIITTDTDHFEMRLFREAPLQIAHSRNRSYARWTPGAPKIQQQNLAAQIFERDEFAVAVVSEKSGE